MNPIKYEMFLNESPGNSSQNPVKPKERPNVPIAATTRWIKNDDGLVKTFRFKESEQRDRFVSALLEYETQIQHHGTIVVRSDRVGIMVMTHDLGTVTEVDKEYASFCDVLYRDITYSPIHLRLSIQRSCVRLTNMSSTEIKTDSSKILMSDVLKGQVEDFDDSIEKMEMMSIYVIVDRTIGPDKLKPFSGILRGISLGIDIEIEMRMSLTDVIDIISENANSISIEGFELHQGENIIKKVFGSFVSKTIRVDEIDVINDLCVLGLQLQPIATRLS